MKKFQYHHFACYIYGIICLAQIAKGDYKLTIVHNNDVHAHFDQINAYSGECTDELARADKCYGGEARRNYFIKECAKAHSFEVEDSGFQMIPDYTHCGVNYGQCIYHDCLSRSSCINGYQHIAGDARERYENTLVLDAGDRFTGTLWFNQYHGEAAQTFVNMEKYDAMCLGNHEFDRGVAGLVPYLRNLTVPVIDANIDISQEARLEGLFNATLIKEVGGVKIGVIGYITTDTAFISNGGPTVKFDDEVTTVRREADKLKSAGVEIVIGLSHAGYGIDKKVALEVDNIDVIVGGHSHTFLYSAAYIDKARELNVRKQEVRHDVKRYHRPQPSKEEIEGPYPTIVTQPSGRKVLVVQAYAWGKYMGFLNVTFDKAFDVKSWSGQPVLLDNTITQDRETLEVINELKKPLEKMKAEIVGRSVVRLQGDPIQCRLRECNSGNLLTDSMIEYHIDKRESNDTWALAAIALLSGGGIRASTEPGDISMGHVLAVQPFGNVIDMIQLRGFHLRQAFEHSVAKYDPHDRPGAFFQMSGAHVIYDISKPSGNRVVSLEVLCLKCTVPMYGPIDDEEIYNILMMDFTIKGGDGFTMIRDNLVRHVQMNSLDSDVFKTYLEKHNPVFADTEGRIKFINSPGVVIPTATASSPSSSASTMSTIEETSDTKCINGANNIGCPLLIGIGMPILVLILKFTNILFCCC